MIQKNISAETQAGFSLIELLIAMGVLIWTNQFVHLNVEAQKWLSRLGLDFWNSV